MAINNQAPLKINDNPEWIRIHSIWKTIQGEGPFVGCPALFIRLTGCNLQCPNCDTNYSSTNGPMHVDMALQVILSHLLTMNKVAGATPLQRMPRLIVITGGEPFRQAGTCRLINSLLTEFDDPRNINVQVETNGTLRPMEELTLSKRLTVVVSPKNGAVDFNAWGGLLFPLPQIHWKYVGAAGNLDPDDGLPTSVLGYSSRPSRPPAPAFFLGNVYLQPEDSKDATENKKNEVAVVESCQRFGYRFTPQLHKILGLP